MVFVRGNREGATQKMSVPPASTNQLREILSVSAPSPLLSLLPSLPNMADQSDLLESKVDAVQTRIDAVEGKQERVERALEGNGSYLVGTTDHVRWMPRP